jgi:SAM-dependent methyltransferase
MAQLNSVSNIEPVSIGIDVGWAAEDRSCCLAVDGLNPPDEDHPMLNRTLVIYRDDAPQTWAMRFQLDELCAFIPTFFADLFARSLRKCSLVIDGPVGPNDPPIQNRDIDTACRRGAFNMRTQPNDVTGNAGQIYVDSTYRILSPFLEAADCDEPWWGGPVTAESFTFAETHPTVGMALMLSQMPIEQIPSRHQSFVTTDPVEVINAKSDWYWRCGANTQVATILGTEAICHETNHELRAGLYCLAVAKMLETSRGTEASDAVAIGFEDGVYAVSRRIHNDWEEATTRVTGTVNDLEMSDLLQGEGNFEYHQDPATVPDFQQREGVHGQQADDGADHVPPLDEVEDIQDHHNMSAFAQAMFDQLQQPDRDTRFRLRIVDGPEYHARCRDFLSLRPEEESLIRDCLGDRQEPRVLDVGCGIGRHSIFSRKFSPHARISIVEIDQSLRDYCISEVPGAVGYEQFANVPADESFDAVFLMGNGLGVFGNEADTCEQLQRLHCLVADGGCVLIESGNPFGGHFSADQHVIEYNDSVDAFTWGYATREWLERELVGVGFEIVTVKPSSLGGRFFICHAKKCAIP